MKINFLKIIVLSTLLCILICMVSCGGGTSSSTSGSDSTSTMSPDSSEMTSSDTNEKAADTSRMSADTSKMVEQHHLPKDTISLAVNISKLDSTGVVVWQLPENMKTLVESLVTVRIALFVNKNSALEGIDTTQKNTSSKAIEIAKKMRVVLLPGENSDFTIVPKDTIHLIPDKSFAEWLWAVTPLKPGTRYLILKVSKIRMDNGKEIVEEEKTVYSQKFKVEVSPSYVAAQILDFTKANWVFISVIISFFVGLFVQKKRKDSKSQANPRNLN